jgi:hypothetical protein
MIGNVAAPDSSRRRIAAVAVAIALAIVLPLAMTAAAGKPAPRLNAHASSGYYPDGPVNITAVVTPSGPGAKISAGTATIHWLGGDQVVALTRALGSASNAVRALVSVPAGQPLGLVGVDVSVTVGATVFNKSITARIVADPTP